MRRLILLCLILLATNPLHAQTDTEILQNLPQVMQLGRGTADTLDWHPDGHVLAVGGSLGLWLYDDALADLAHFPDTGEITWLAWSPDGHQLAIADGEGSVSMWDVALEPYSITLNRTWTFQDEYYLRFSWVPDGERLAVITSNGAQVLDVNSGETLLTILDLEHTLAWHPDGTQIAGAVDLGEEIGEQVRVWDATSGEVISTYFGVDSGLYWSDIQWSPDGSVLVGITFLPATLYAWSIETGDLLSDIDTFSGEFGDYYDMWWLEGGAKLAVSESYVSAPGAQDALEIWDTTTWMPQGNFLIGNPQQIARRPVMNEWITTTWDGQLMMWGLEKNEPLRVRSVYGQSLDILAWSPDNHHLASANHMGELFNVWDVTIPDQPESQAVMMKPYQHWVLDELHWSADNTKLIGILSTPGITAPGAFPIAFVVEWDAQTGKYLDTINETLGYVAHDGSGNYLPHDTWSDDFTRVATELSDEPITVSTVATSEYGMYADELISTIDVVDDISRICWSPDNTMLAVISRDPQGETSAWVYDTETGNLVNRLNPSSPAMLYDITWSPDSSMVALVSRRNIAGGGETEYRLDVLEVDPSSEEAAHVTTILDTDRTFYHTWHPESLAIAVTTSSGVGIYPMQSAPIGMDIPLTYIFPDMRVFALAWSPDGMWLTGGCEDGTVRVWDVRGVSR